VHRLLDTLHGQVGLKAVHLAAERVTLDGDVHQTESPLIALDDVLRQHDHTRAGAPDGLSLPGHLADRPVDLEPLHQLADRGALAAGDDQRVARLDLLARLDRPRLHVLDLVECLNVLLEISLQRQYANDLRHRSASPCVHHEVTA
jgi:hypothetical protein